MQTHFAELDALFKQVQADDAAVLTPNRRLARFLHTQFSYCQIAEGRKAWSSYPCWFVDDWLRDIWQSVLLDEAPKILLTKSQEIALWIKAIRASHRSDSLFNLEATAEVARRAWRHLCQWQTTCAVIDNLDFKQWLDHYRRFCTRERLLDPSSLVQRLTEAIARGQYALPRHLILFAFDDINPQLRQLFVAIEARGVRVEPIDIYVNNSLSRRLPVAEGEAEMTLAAHWAAAIIDRQPHANIGIVIPQLTQQRAEVERIFNRVFHPQYLLPDTPSHTSGFNISVGVPLSSTALVAAALSALELNRHTVTIEQVSQLLISPFIGIDNELSARAALDVQLRRDYLQLSIDDLCRALAELGADGEGRQVVADFYRRLSDFRQFSLSTVTQAATDKRAPSEWAQIFSRQLAILGWPGSRSLDTMEFQQLDRWQQVILQLAGFDAILANVTIVHAMELLQRLALDTQFQPQTDNSPVQLLGLFEAAGLLFDYLWVMQLDSESWPMPIAPNPLLPLRLQQDKQMPMASVQRELTVAKQLTRRLKHSAAEVILSHSTRSGDTLLYPSPLIESVPAINASQLPHYAAANYWQVIADTSCLESFIDDRGPVLDRRTALRGGVQILKDQAACPFRAFAIHRLRALPIVDAQPGLTAAKRGSLMHMALAIIWRHLQSHAALMQLSDEMLQRLIDDSVSRSFHLTDTAGALGLMLKQLESDRLCRLLTAWMDIEKQRQPFQVKYSEAKASLTLGPLSIHLRCDRIDQLADGRLVVIDYKTAKADIRTWSGPRPDEPQVPLYAIMHPQQLSAVAFGQIHIDQIAFKGVGADDHIIPQLSTPPMLSHLDFPNTWPQLLDNWRDVLTALAEEFAAGFAAVQPKYQTLSCRYCSLHSLCRVNRQRMPKTPKAIAVQPWRQ